jgi:hypothetical protein
MYVVGDRDQQQDVLMYVVGDRDQQQDVLAISYLIRGFVTPNHSVQED